MNWFKRRLLKHAVKLALSKPTTMSPITLTGSDAEQNDNYVLYLDKPDYGSPERYSVLVTEISGTKIQGKLLVEGKYSKSVINDLDDFLGGAFLCRHYLQYIRIGYRSTLGLICGHYFQKTRRTLRADQRSQRKYNRNTEIRDGLYDLRKDFLILYHEKPENKKELSRPELLVHRYGDRVFEHPEHQLFDDTLRLQLEALQDKDELTGDGFSYKPKGGLLSAIAEIEETKQRHADAVDHNKRIFWLTRMIVLIGFLNLILAAI